MIRLRDETPGDGEAIARVITRAFAGAPHASGAEAAIVSRLREEGALDLSLVAEDAAGVVGHAAFSPVTIDGRMIRPLRQRLRRCHLPSQLGRIEL